MKYIVVGHLCSYLLSQLILFQELSPKFLSFIKFVFLLQELFNSLFFHILFSFQKAPKEMVECFFKYVKLNKLQHEVNVSKERGNLDKVFKKYCG